MRIRRRWRLVWLALACSRAWTAPVELKLDNPGFEADAGPDSRPPAWRLERHDRPVVVDCGQAKSGRCALRFDAADIDEPASSDGFQILPAQRLAGRHVKVSGWMRVESGAGDQGRLMLVGAASGRRLDFHGAGRPGDDAWQLVEFEAAVPADARALALMMGFGGAGQAWFGDLQVSVDGADPVAALADAPLVPPPRPVASSALTPLPALRLAPETQPAIPNAWREDIRTRSHPIASLWSEDFSDLQFLKPLLQGKRVVQLGESAHGVAEFNWMKARLVAFLHRELGFDVLAFEGNLSGCDQANGALAAGKPQAAMKDCLFPVWHTREVEALFDDLARQPGAGDPLKLAGFDDQPAVYPPDTREFDSLLGPLAPRLAARLRARDVRVVGSNEPSAPALVEDYRRAEALLIALRERAKDPALVRRLGLAAQEARSRQSLVRQVADPDPAASNRLRDRVMADNLDFLLDTLHPGRKVIVWAHNAHIRKTFVGERDAPMMGHWTAERHGREVYTIGLFAGRGVHRSIDMGHAALHPVPPLLPDSLEAVLANAGWAASFVDLEHATPNRSAHNGWMQTPLRAGIYEGDSVVPALSYDGLLYIDAATPPADFVPRDDR